MSGSLKPGGAGEASIKRGEEEPMPTGSLLGAALDAAWPRNAPLRQRPFRRIRG
jgi:hypothetical protein